MKERPILFSGEMVRAILDGRKTQTRRLSGLDDINKNPEIWNFNRYGELNYMTKKQYKGRFGAYFQTQLMMPGTMHICPVSSPYGKPGDRLWLKETWAQYRNDPDIEGLKDYHPVIYKASEYPDDFQGPWKPSIHMPRWASRITLEIIEVRVERLQDISEEDARAEGVILPGNQCDYIGVYRDHFQRLWDSINGKKHPWESNPWVWVVSFKRVES